MKKIKIVLVMNNFFIGGAEKLLLGILGRIDKEKFDIYIITILGSGPLKDDFERLNFPIKFFGFKNNSLTFLHKILWLFFSPFIILKLIIFLKKIKPDIVVTSLYQADILGILTAWLCGIKKRIIIQHDVKELSPFRKFLKKRVALDLATFVIANSFSVKKFLIDYFGVNSEKIIIIKNGVDIEKLKEGIKTESVKNELTLGFIGRLEPVKGLFCLMKALKSLKKEMLEIKTFIVGEGSLRKKLEKYAKDNNLRNIEFIGEVSDLEKILKKIDILVVPSLAEGFGLVVLEGLASEKVVIASDIPAFRELIIDGENGKLFQKGNVDSLVSVLKEILTDRELFKKLRKNVKVWLREKGPDFDIKKTAQNYQELFASL